MPDFLNTSLSALATARRAMDVTGHNIANVNTEGYSRQRATLSARLAEQTPAGFIGTGVTVSSVDRVLNELLSANIQSSTSAHARLDTLAGYSTRINNLLADPNAGLAPRLERFFGALQDAANDPAATDLRQHLLGEGEALVERFALIDGELRALDEEINRSLSLTVTEINGLTGEIAALNGEIATARGASGGREPNDLLDRRDLLIGRLAELVGISTVETSDGHINILVKPGNSLVTGTIASQFDVGRNALDPARLDIQLRATESGTPRNIAVEGGRLGALLEARTQHVDAARRELGLTATALAVEFNRQSHAGFDLAGAFGGDFFELGPIGTLDSSANTGNATFDISVADVGALTADGYDLVANGAGFDIVRISDGSTVTATGAGTVADPLLFDGLSIVVSGAPSTGDRFQVQPTRGAASSLGIAIVDPDRIALAFPVRATSEAANGGGAIIAVSDIVDPDDPALLGPADIEFTSATTFSVNGSGSFSYVSGEAILVNGVEVVIEGVPASGDRFQIEANDGATGDNRNALALAGLETAPALNNGRDSLIDSYAGLVARVGSRTTSLQTGLEAQDLLLQSAEYERQRLSGVDLDEEAANLIRFQQSYQAATQLIATANTIFDELIGAVRR